MGTFFLPANNALKGGTCRWFVSFPPEPATCIADWPSSRVTGLITRKLDTTTLYPSIHLQIDYSGSCEHYFNYIKSEGDMHESLNSKCTIQ